MGKTFIRIFWGLTTAAMACQALCAVFARTIPARDRCILDLKSCHACADTCRPDERRRHVQFGNGGTRCNFFLKPLSSKRRTNADEANRKLLTLRVTYRCINNVDEANEDRLQFDMAPKFLLPKDMLLDDRNRLELRIISGDVTWRYRNRLTFQRTFQTHRFKFTLYARAEAFYEINQGECVRISHHAMYSGINAGSTGRISAVGLGGIQGVVTPANMVCSFRSVF